MVKKYLGGAVIAGLFAAALIPAYTFFVDNDSNSLNKNVVFEYSGKKVYESQLLPYINYYLKMSGNSDVSTRNLAVDNYIRSVLMAEFAIENGYTVENFEIEDFIKKVPALMIDGEFSNSKYEEFIKVLGIKKHLFEDEVRKDLLIVKMMEKVDGFSNIKDFYFDIIKETLSQKRTLEKVKIDMNKIIVNYKEEDIEKIYNLNKEKYKQQDDIVFNKITYIHPLNQSENIEELEMVKLDTNAIYEAVKTNGKNIDLEKEGFKKSEMTINKDNFYNLTGVNNKQIIDKNMFLIDNTNVDNGVINVYQVTDIKAGRGKTFSEAKNEIIDNYTIDKKIGIAFDLVSSYKDIKDTIKNDKKIFLKYEEEVLNPLDNIGSDYLYDLAYSMPVNDIKFYYENKTNEYFFIKLKSIDALELTEEQLNYFKISQNNMYKQFIIISLYDGIKRKYNLIKHKKEDN